MNRMKISPSKTPPSSVGDINEVLKKNGSVIKRISKYWQMIIVIVIPIIAMVIFSSIHLVEAINLKETTDKAISQIITANSFSSLVKMLQRERGMSATFISLTTNRSFDTLIEARHQTDSAVKTTPFGEKNFIINNQSMSKNDIVKSLSDFRYTVLIQNTTLSEILTFYTGITNTFMNGMLKGIEVPSGNNIYPDLVAFVSMLRWLDVLGLQRAFISYLHTTCEFNSLNRQVYVFYDATAKSYQEVTFSYSSSIEKQYKKSNYTANTYLESVEKVIWYEEFIQICRNQSQERRLITSLEWFKNISVYIDSAFAIRSSHSISIMEKLEKVGSSAKTRWIVFLLVQVFVALFSLALFLWYLYCIEKVSFTLVKYDFIKTKTKELAREKKLTEALLYLMLPKKIAIELITNGRVPAEEFPNASIYFSDIVNFTVIASKCSPMQIVDLLNDLYSLFDNCIEKYDVYKVETIGDAYMVSSGIPTPNENTHASEICHMALDIRESMTDFKPTFNTESSIMIRIGIHSGTCVAGVVGRKMPRYCLFGDTVNTASRMESTGLGGKIQISSSTHQLLQGIGVFITILRGATDIKGKGVMTTYWLEGRYVTPRTQVMYDIPANDTESAKEIATIQTQLKRDIHDNGAERPGNSDSEQREVTKDARNNDVDTASVTTRTDVLRDVPTSHKDQTEDSVPVISPVMRYNPTDSEDTCKSNYTQESN